MTPTVACFVLITEKLPDDVKSTDFQSANKIKKLDLDGFNCRISQFGTQDLTLFGHYPLFPVKDDIINVLKKLGVPFIEESRIDAEKIYLGLESFNDQFIDENIKVIFTQLPIWPTYSADDSYTAAYCDCLVPHGLPYFQAKGIISNCYLIYDFMILNDIPDKNNVQLLLLN
ncbi:hypothetical protein C2G38_2300528 [Gigaspora rosea]|uniref:Uncharacterized protein n=1 Tax=Gigaspora rosea TaxID=44941 RepID=A0A397VIZ3_9GLOM|nr:hypothetical protein C2G38_2300528 [Gigaspora rosea]